MMPHLISTVCVMFKPFYVQNAEANHEKGLLCVTPSHLLYHPWLWALALPKKAGLVGYYDDNTLQLQNEHPASYKHKLSGAQSDMMDRNRIGNHMDGVNMPNDF